MKAFMNWLEHSFAPAAKKFTQRPWIAAVASAMQKCIPFILAGSIIFFYNAIRSYATFLPDIGIIGDYSFGMLSLITAFMIANQAMEKLRHPGYTISAGIVAICVFMMFVRPEIVDGELDDNLYRLGATGIMVSMIVGLVVAAVFHNYAKLKVLQGSDIPDFLIEWVNNILPTLISLGIFAALIFGLNIDLFDVITDAMQPIMNFGQTLPGMILLVFLPTFFYSMGISSWIFSAIQNPIFFAGIQANMAAVAAGLPPECIVTNETVYGIGLIMMGGTGATLGLNILMLFSKSRKIKTMGRVGIGPSIFNINEPIVFSTIVMKPMLMLPMWINGLVGPTIIYLVMKAGWLNFPFELNNIAQIPAPISSVMMTHDFRAIIWYVVMFAIYLAVWYPFFKIHEKEVLKEENEALEETKKERAAVTA